MLKKTITYTDYEGTERTEDFYFNLTKAEIAEMEMERDGGLVRLIEKIVAEQDAKEIVGLFKDLILRSYGEKSADGRRFIKTDQVREEFAQTEAYSELFMELATNADSAVTFVDGITPKVPNADKAEMLSNANKEI